MNPEHKPDPSVHARLTAEIAALERAAVAARAELAALRADPAQAQAQIGSHQKHQPLEANEQRVLDAMRARGAAESAAQLVAELSRSSELDALTALPNRVLLVDRMAQALTQARRNDTRLALLLLDLDGFKAINDSRGQQVGDEVLRTVGQCLVACVRRVDTVCRLGGDEFLLLLSEIAEAADAGLVAEKLLKSLSELAATSQSPLPVRASIGISVFPDDATDTEGLVDCADRAMYSSKRAGGARYRFFSALGTHPGEGDQMDLHDAPAQREERGARLRDVNERLVLSAMAATAAVEQQEQMLAGLQTAARNKDEFLSVLGHELRNPLAPLLTTLDVLRMRGGGYETVEHATMRRHVSHMVRLVDDLQDVAKIASGKVELRVERVPIEHLALQAIALAKPLMEQRQQHFAFAESPERLACWGDPVRLTQCLSNLLINAAKYTPPGGSISLTTSRDGEQAVIAVKDDGRGISAAALPDVFNLFFQERVDANSLTGGLGVGLALVRSLVALHAGSVAASSAGIGRGSEFVIRLPLIDEEDGPQAVRGSQPTVAALHPPRRVLIVDDNYDAADSLAELLRLYGHEVWVATHPVAALQMIGTAAPELALLDIGLPDMDGYELAALIRKENPGLQVALVALSGYGRTADQARSAQAGFQAHLVKPVDIEVLERILQSVHPSPMPAD